jgi:hypothetical protein
MTIELATIFSEARTQVSTGLKNIYSRPSPYSTTNKQETGLQVPTTLQSYHHGSQTVPFLSRLSITRRKNLSPSLGPTRAQNILLMSFSGGTSTAFGACTMATRCSVFTESTIELFCSGRQTQKLFKDGEMARLVCHWLMLWCGRWTQLALCQIVADRL